MRYLQGASLDKLCIASGKNLLENQAVRAPHQLARTSKSGLGTGPTSHAMAVSLLSLPRAACFSGFSLSVHSPLCLRTKLPRGGSSRANNTFQSGLWVRGRCWIPSSGSSTCPVPMQQGCGHPTHACTQALESLPRLPIHAAAARLIPATRATTGRSQPRLLRHQAVKPQLGQVHG